MQHLAGRAEICEQTPMQPAGFRIWTALKSVQLARIQRRVLHSPAMPSEVLQRFNWTGTPIEMADLFIVHKHRRQARGVIFSHVFGWEVRLLVGSQAEIVRTHVCRTQEEVFSTGEQWKEALITEGWT